jgi:hypothetical protein
LIHSVRVAVLRPFDTVAKSTTGCLIISDFAWPRPAGNSFSSAIAGAANIKMIAADSSRLLKRMNLIPHLPDRLEYGPLAAFFIHTRKA